MNVMPEDSEEGMNYFLVFRSPIQRQRWPIPIALSVCRIAHCGQMVQEVYRSLKGMWGRHFDWYHFRSPDPP